MTHPQPSFPFLRPPPPQPPPPPPSQPLPPDSSPSFSVASTPSVVVEGDRSKTGRGYRVDSSIEAGGFRTTQSGENNPKVYRHPNERLPNPKCVLASPPPPSASPTTTTEIAEFAID